MESAHLQSVSLCMFLSSESGKTYLFKVCTDAFLGETSILDIGRGYDGWVGWGRGHGP